MRILLINPPIREGRPAFHRPFGLASIAQVLRDAGHIVLIYDINSTRHTREEVAHYLPRERFDMVGVGGLISIYKYLNFLFPLLRERYKNTPIVLGGGGITSAPEVFMENLCPDYGILGEGEYTMLELASGDEISGILGLVYHEADKLKFNPPRPLEKSLDKFGRGALDLLDMEKYTQTSCHQGANTELAMIATRGCPRNCSFCYHVFGRSMRYRSLESVLDELEYLIFRYKVESIMFCDELFTARKSYVMQFCEELIKKQINIAWSCLSRVDTIDEEMMALMNRAGCRRIGFGFESGSQRILDEMNKGVTVEQATTSCRLAAKYFRTVHGTFVYGMPSENRETVEETIRWWTNTGVRILSRLYYLNPYPGTKVYHDNFDKIIKKYSSEHNYFLALSDASEFVINLTELSDEEYFNHRYYLTTEIERKMATIIPIRLAEDIIPSDFIYNGTIFCIHPSNVAMPAKDEISRLQRQVSRI